MSAAGLLSRATTTCVAPESGGVAFPLWRLVQERAAELGLNGVQLAERVGLRRATIDNLRTSSRSPQPRIVEALVSGLQLDRREAFQAAGRIPPDGVEGGDDLRDLIARSQYTPAQREALLEALDAFDSFNRSMQSGSAGRESEGPEPGEG